MTQTKLILLAEADILDQRVAVRQLETLGHRVAAVSNGRDALAALTSVSYDLVLMNCQMPEMDGYETTAEIRRREGINNHTTIVAMVALGRKADGEKCLAVGMDDYISKPVKPRDLESLLERTFALPAGPNQPGVSTKAPPPVDLEHIYDVMGEESSEILDLYLTGTSQDLVRLTSAIQTNNVNEVDSIAHNLAGTSATCGMVAVVPAFRALEKAAREGCLDNAPALLEEAKQQFERISSFLKTEFIPQPVD